MQIKTFVVGVVRTNCYLVYEEFATEAVLIDPGARYERIKAFCDQNGLKVTAVLLTHGHFDHILHAALWQEQGAKIYVHSADADKLHSDKNLQYLVGANVPPCYADVLLKDGDTVDAAGFTFTVIHTPGHSAGSVSYRIGDVIFTGDTLFLGDYGRTDFPDSDFSALQASVARLFALEGDFRVLPGHDQETTLQHERETNAMRDVL